MKKIFLSILFILLVIGLPAQVGINTVNPKGVLHIDGASTAATTNPSTGTITNAQAVDDVVIASSGNVAVGHPSPNWGKLHIVSPTAGRGLRIRDGARKFRILSSGYTTMPGNAKWQNTAKSWSAALFEAAALPNATTLGFRQYTNFAEGFISSPTMGAVDKVNGRIKLPADGTYRITMSAYFGCSWYPGTGAYSASLNLVKGSAGILEGIALGNAPYNGVHPTFIFVIDLEKDDVLTMVTNETANYYSNSSEHGLLLVELIRVKE